MFTLVWMGISAISYTMYLVAWIFESRKPGSGPNDVPVWRGQSKAFLPGDFGLGLAVTTTLWMPHQTPDWSRSWWWTLVSFAAGATVYYVGRRVAYKPEDYTPQAWRSPSKRWHDLVMFFGFTTVSFMFVVPKLIISFGDPTNQTWVAVTGIVFWMVLGVWDLVSKETPNPRQHPTHYRPIWRK